jgi:hypothetical protein
LPRGPTPLRASANGARKRSSRPCWPERCPAAVQAWMHCVECTIACSPRCPRSAGYHGLEARVKPSFVRVRRLIGAVALAVGLVRFARRVPAAAEAGVAPGGRARRFRDTAWWCRRTTWPSKAADLTTKHSGKMAATCRHTLYHDYLDHPLDTRADPPSWRPDRIDQHDPLRHSGRETSTRNIIGSGIRITHTRRSAAGRCGAATPRGHQPWRQRPRHSRGGTVGGCQYGVAKARRGAGRRAGAQLRGLGHGSPDTDLWRDDVCGLRTPCRIRTRRRRSTAAAPGPAPRPGTPASRARRADMPARYIPTARQFS